MAAKVKRLNLNSKRPLLVGVIHLAPLPGSPRWGGDMAAVVKGAVCDARAYAEGGADAVVVENFGDVPFTKGALPPETIAAMARAGAAVRDAVDLPLGFNALRNDAAAGLALCAACDGGFIRVNVHSGSMLTDQGLIEGRAFETLRARTRLCPDVQILADVHVKHATPLGGELLEDAARDTAERGLADGLIVSGSGTGQATDPQTARRVHEACPKTPVFIGSGADVKNVDAFLPYVRGVIVGSSLKRGGRLHNPVDAKRVEKLRQALVGTPRRRRPTLKP